MLTLQERDAIRARAQAATKGKWDWNNGEEGFEFGPNMFQSLPFSADFPHPGFVPNGEGGNGAQRDQLLRDQEFFAHARTDIPRLLDDIEILAEENDALREFKADRDALVIRCTALTKEVERLREFVTERTACRGCGERISYSRADDPDGVTTLALHIKSESHRKAVHDE